MNLQPIGPEGARRRMEEIQARMRQLSTPKETQKFEMPQGSTPMSGTIGAPSSQSFSPMSPFAPGSSITVPGAPDNLHSMIQSAAGQHGLDPALLDALVQTESGYNPTARSRVGAMGLTQLMPGTAEALGVKNAFDPQDNLNGGAKYLSQMIQKFDGDLPKALAAYNAGPGAVMRAGGIPPYAETQNYVKKVMSLYEARKNA